MPRILAEVLSSERNHAVGTGWASACGAPGVPGTETLNCETLIGAGGRQRGFHDSCLVCTVRMSEITCCLCTGKYIPYNAGSFGQAWRGKHGAVFVGYGGIRKVNFDYM